MKRFVLVLLAFALGGSRRLLAIHKSRYIGYRPWQELLTENVAGLLSGRPNEAYLAAKK
jgi:hypothetical protein